MPRYFIGRYPVTVAQFQAFVEDIQVELEDRDALRGIASHPVVTVSWHEALKYCRWLTEKLRGWDETPEPLAKLLRQGEGDGRPWQVTLPSEAEWEKAARGTDGRRYPWVGEVDANLANSGLTEIGRTTAVGSFPGGESPYGVADLSGNTWEWTRSVWTEDYSKPEDRYPARHVKDVKAKKDSPRVLRGGAFNLNPRNLRSAYRNSHHPNNRNRNNWFRVVVSTFFERRHCPPGRRSRGPSRRMAGPVPAPPGAPCNTRAWDASSNGCARGTTCWRRTAGRRARRQRPRRSL